MAPYIPLTRRGFLSATFLGIAASLPAEAAVPTRGETPATSETSTGEQARLYDIFMHPPDSARPMTRWWWFGGAATPREITRELEMMRAAGLRGVELQPVYPLEVDNPQSKLEIPIERQVEASSPMATISVGIRVAC